MPVSVTRAAGQCDARERRRQITQIRCSVKEKVCANHATGSRARSQEPQRMWLCNSCGHYHGANRCQAITETETGGARKCSCTGQEGKEN
jgi:hypothetical protein